MSQLIIPMKEQYEEYIIDESKFAGYADSISFPENEEEIGEVLRQLKKEGIPVTVQGGKTGITGAAVPMGGHIMNLSHMNQIKDSGLKEDGTGYITVEPGVNLMDLKKEINSIFRKTPLFWPPDPTETSASIGGIAASGAQGITSLLYGKTRNYIEAVTLIDYEGQKKRIQKGERLTLPSGREMDALDAVLGREGITGIISELTLLLLPKPESIWGIAFFFEKEEDTGRFIDMLKTDMPKAENASVAAAEYLDREAIRLVEQRKSTMTKIKELPDVTEETDSMLYVEIHGAEEDIELIAEELMESAMVCGSNPDEAWAVSEEADIEKMHAFRHGAAETANLCIEEARRLDGRIRKLGTDMTLGEASFAHIIECSRSGLEEAGLKGCIFGHALQNHLHVNVLPEDFEEYERGKALVHSWALQVKGPCSKVGTEHGYGKLKRELLGELIPENFVEECRELKGYFDKDYKVNPGNIFQC